MPNPTKSKTKTSGASAPKTSSKAAVKAKTAKPEGAVAKKTASKPRGPLNQGTLFPVSGTHCGWSLVDAKNIPLGRLSSFVAHLLMGKNKPQYTRHADTGDFVVVINAKDVVLTGKKWEEKTYYWHTNYPGGIKSVTAQKLLETHPERLIAWSVSGMLPKGHLGRKWVKKLRVFPGAEHSHAAQKPQAVKLPNLGIFDNRE